MDCGIGNAYEDKRGPPGPGVYHQGVAPPALPRASPNPRHRAAGNRGASVCVCVETGQTENRRNCRARLPVLMNRQVPPPAGGRCVSLIIVRILSSLAF